MSIRGWTVATESSGDMADRRVATASHPARGPPLSATPPNASGHGRLRRTLSGIRTSNDLRFDVFFHMPHQAELSRLRVHRSISLVTLQAMIQREFNVAFEEQRLYYHGDLLEGDEELTFYDIHDQSVINVHVKKRYRRIGDIFSKIKIVRFSKSHADDFEVIDVVASLPPLKVVFRRLAVAIAYLMSLDHMQAQRTGRLVWRQRVNFWDEPLTNTFTRVVPARGNRGAIVMHSSMPATVPVSGGPSSFVLVNCSPERVSYLMSLAQTVSLRQRLELPPECRSSADLRHIKRWLGSIKYFADANIPDSVIQEIARFSTFASFRSGDYIFREGDVGDFFYIVISGCVSLSAYGNGLFATMTPGMCFGEISLFQTQGRRTATANVNFASQEAELAVVSGDLYRRAINPYKQAVLQNTERAIFSIPQLRFLPDHVITHIAYAAKTLTARTGRRLIRHGDEVHVLVLVVEGEVKVSTPRQLRHLSKLQLNEQPECEPKEPPIVSVVRAPAVFGQEGCLGSTPSPAPWDIEAIDNVTLVCLRMDTISIFISPHNGIIRALMLEHQERVHDFHRRFTTAAQEREKQAAAHPPFLSPQQRRASHLRLLSTPKLTADDVPMRHDPRKKRHHLSVAARIAFPKILLKGDSLPDGKLFSDVMPTPPSRALRSVTTAPVSKRRPLQRSGPPIATCADLQDAFLHQALPYAQILGLSDQIRFASFEKQKQQPNDEEVRAKTKALVSGLRQLQAEEVKLLPRRLVIGDCPPQYHFAPTGGPSVPVSDRSGI